MAIKLYRKGNTHCVNGIECEVRMFRATTNSLDFVGVDGWCLKPEDINKKDEWSEYTADQIRSLAKDADIEDWDTKRINTLKELLSGQSAES